MSSKTKRAILDKVYNPEKKVINATYNEFKLNEKTALIEYHKFKRLEK
jgi:hypothetical protein